MLDLELIGTPAFGLEIVGQDFRYVALNQRLQVLMGLSIERMRGLTPHDCFPKAIADTIVSRYRECVRNREAVEYEQFYDMPGGKRWWAVAVTPVIDQASSQVTALLGIAVDITGRRAAELANQEAAARLSLAMEVIDGGFWHMDVPTADFRTSLPLASLVAGDGSPELDLEDYLSYIVSDDLPAADLSQLVSGFLDESVAEYRVRTFAGEIKWMRCKRRLVRNHLNRPQRIVGVAIDVTEQKALQARYKQQATTDMLTGLANRRKFEVKTQERMQEARQTGRPFGLLMIDLDGFKPVNDRFGHAAGDAVLQEVAVRFEEAMRDQDLVARFGGDEFAILIDDIDEAGMQLVASLVVRALAKPFSVGGHSVTIGASVGPALWGLDDRSVDDIVLRADRALYVTKNTGRRKTWAPAA